MSQQLIPTFNGKLAGEFQPLVNARDLHAALDVGKDFSTWIKDRIERYGFTEGEDYSPNSGSGKNQGLRRFVPGGNRIDYHLSLDMAKELAILEGNDKGRQARKYFIEMEKIARREVAALPAPGLDAARIERLKDAIFAARPEWAKVSRYMEMGLSQAEIGRLLGKSRAAVQHIERNMADHGLVARRHLRAAAAIKQLSGGAS